MRLSSATLALAAAQAAVAMEMPVDEERHKLLYESGVKHMEIMDKKMVSLLASGH